MHDDLAFAFRIFNTSHINAIEKESQKKVGIDDAFRFKSSIIAGTAQSRTKQSYLLKKAKGTFLRKRKCYPYIGILRLKVDFRLLRGRGFALFESLDKKLNTLFHFLKGKSRVEVMADYMVFDSNDNDELVIMGFANNLSFLYDYFTEIQQLSYDDLYPSERMKSVKHIFTVCHTNYGYDIQYNAQRKDGENFLPCKKTWEITFNCYFEAKPGHLQELSSFLEGRFNCNPQVCEGHYIVAQLSLSDVMQLHMASNSNIEVSNFLQKHTLRVKFKIVGPSTGTPFLQDNDRPHYETNHPARISLEDKADVKYHLTQLGVSKITRERLLALLDFYNDCVEHRLQQWPFMQLKPAVATLDVMLRNLIESDAELPIVEEIINNEVSALEGAMYNRLNNNLSPNIILEYGGGVQQYLLSFGYAYSIIGDILSISNSNSLYLLISGNELVSSTRTHFEMNINHIISPQLFCTIAWKEAANYSSLLSLIPKDLDTGNEDPEELSFWHKIKTFQDFQLDSDSAQKLVRILSHEVSFLGSTDLLEDVIASIGGIDAYIINDFIVYHFAFQRDFSLMWFHYWSIFLQTASTYGRDHKIRQRKFVVFILRLMLVGLLDDEIEHCSNDNGRFLLMQASKPFDYSMAQVWVAYYMRLYETALSLKRVLCFYGLNEVLEGLTTICEFTIAGIPQEEPKQGICKLALKSRERVIKKLVVAFENGKIIDGRTFSYIKGKHERVLVLFNAYLRVIKDLSEPFKPVKCIPIVRQMSLVKELDSEHDTHALTDSYAIFSQLLSDPKGGFFCISPETRRKYYQYNTILHKTLWNMSYLSDDSIT